MRIRRLLQLSLLFISISASAQDLQQKLNAAFGRLQQDSQCRYASLSLTVLDAKTGETVFAANPDMGLATASTLKTITSATAFYLLGKDFKYQTWINYVGKISDSGVLTGDIIITGGGDPTLGSWRWESTKEKVVLNTIVQIIKKAGIKSINGRIIADDSIFGTQTIPEGWIWQDVGNYYGAGTSGLCFRENQFDIKLRTGAVGEPIAIASTVPTMQYYKFKSELYNAPAGTGDKSYAFLPVGNQTFYLRGTYATDQTKKSISVALPDAAYDLAFRLKDTLARLGMIGEVQTESVGTLNAKGITWRLYSFGQIIPAIESPPLSKIVYWLNQKSVNLYAEQLLKTLAWKAGKPVSTANGVKVLQDFWKTKGIDPASLNIVDGSGLSPGDRVTTQTLARVLKTVKTEAWFPDYYESLPTYNNMKMKSGTINDGLSYAGYQTKGGRDLCFSIIVNNYSGSTTGMRQKMFRVLDELK